MKINAQLKGFNVSQVKQFQKRLLSAKKQASKAALKATVKETSTQVANDARGSFNVKSKTFAGQFTGKSYDTIPERMPAVLFYTRSNYFSIFEFGGTIKPKKQSGLFILFVEIYKQKKAVRLTQFLANLRQRSDTFWKKGKNGNLILYAVATRENSKSISKFKKSFKQKNNLKQVKSGTAIPIGVLVQSVSIKKRFDFTNIAKNRFTPNFIKNFEDNLDLSKV